MAYRANAQFDAHRDGPEFGYRFLAGEAKASGQRMSERTAWRICRENGWRSAFGKKRARNGKRPGPPVHDDLVRRDFTATRPNQLWLTDITEHPTAQVKLHLCAIKDAWSGRIVGYSIDRRMKARLAVNALNNAVTRRGNVAGCIVHSDRGSQFRRQEIRPHPAPTRPGRIHGTSRRRRRQRRHGILLRPLQKNVLDRRRWATRDDLRTAMVTWIERTYHRRRRRLRLGRLTPIEFETTMKPTATPAA